MQSNCACHYALDFNVLLAAGAARGWLRLAESSKLIAEGEVAPFGSQVPILRDAVEGLLGLSKGLEHNPGLRICLSCIASGFRAGMFGRKDRFMQ